MKSTDKPIALIAAIVILGLAAQPAAAGERMSEAEIAAALTGITLDGIYFNGSYFTETYRDDGTVRYWDAVAADSGEWSIRDGEFCTFYESQQGACFVVERDGTNCFTFIEPDPDTGKIDPQKWTSRGWNRKHPPTCAVAPEIGL